MCGVVQFLAGPVSNKHKLEHDPLEDNRGHCNIYGVDVKVRTTLSRIARWVEDFSLE